MSASPYRRTSNNNNNKPHQSSSSSSREQQHFSTFTEEFLIASPINNTRSRTKTIVQQQQDQEKLDHIDNLLLKNNNNNRSHNHQKTDERDSDRDKRHQHRIDLRRLEQTQNARNETHQRNLQHLFAPFVMILPDDVEDEGGDGDDNDDGNILIASPVPASVRRAVKAARKNIIVKNKMSPKRRERKETIIDVDEDDGDDDDATSSSSSSSDTDDDNYSDIEESSIISLLPKNVAIFCRSPAVCVDLNPRRRRTAKLDALPEIDVKDIEKTHSIALLRKHKMIPHQIPAPIQTKITCSFCSRQASSNRSTARIQREWLQCPVENGCCCTRPPHDFITIDEGIILPMARSASTNRQRHLENDLLGTNSIGALRRSLCKQCVLDILDDPRHYRSVEEWRKVRKMMEFSH